MVKIRAHKFYASSSVPMSYRAMSFLIVLSGWIVPVRAGVSSWPVVVRDHLAGTSTLIQVPYKLYDSTAGSWVGTRPGIDGLPTPATIWDPPFEQNRHVLQKTDTPPGWPGRIAIRFDRQNVTGTFAHECSGVLVGPKFALTAAHCVNYRSYETIEFGWTSDSNYVRPGFDRGHDLPEANTSGRRMAPVRIVKSWVSRSVFENANERGFPYSGDDDWAILELERDVGTDLGWAAVGPLKPGDENRKYHFLGYPGRPQCGTGAFCDTVSRSDSLSHSYTPVELNYWDPTGKDQKLDWRPLVNSWFGESGSGFLDCPDAKCLAGRMVVRGTRWTEFAISAVDSIMSGVIATLLKDVKIPASVVTLSHSNFDLHLDHGFLRATSAMIGEWQILSLDGRNLTTPTLGRSFSISADRLPRGVALVVFRSPGQVPVTQRWTSP